MTHIVSTYRHSCLSGQCRANIFFTWLTLLWVAVLPAVAQQQLISLSVNEKENIVLAIDHVQLSACDSDKIALAMSFALKGNTLPRQERIRVTPRLVYDGETSDFPTIEILGRWAYYHDVRTPQNLQHVPDTLQYRDREVADNQSYHQTIARMPWMNGATLLLTIERTDGCGGATMSQKDCVLRKPSPIVSQRQDVPNAVVRSVDVKHFNGRAYVAFPVSRTHLDPEFRNNRQELDRLRSTIDSVAADPNIEILSIQIKGYASPEGSYELNDHLARERTNSLARYITENTKVIPTLFHTSSEPEDWQGLRTFVDTTSLLSHRHKLLELIDSKLYPDEKLSQISSRYPNDYKVLSEKAFPLLRHTDYQIDYQLREITLEQDPQVPVVLDTLWQLAIDQPTDTLECMQRRIKSYKPLLAVKTNLLYDLLLAPNIEVEVPFGRNRRWSLMAEYTNPWWRIEKLQHAYEIQEAGVELRRWLTPRCDDSRPWLCGVFAGVYLASAKYDLEYDGVGDQGEIWSTGVTCGYSMPIGRRWNLEFSLSAGFLSGNRRHYHAEFDSTHLIYRETKNLRYVGPTKVKVSLVWIIPDFFKKKE